MSEDGQWRCTSTWKVSFALHCGRSLHANTVPLGFWRIVSICLVIVCLHLRPTLAQCGGWRGPIQSMDRCWLHAHLTEQLVCGKSRVCTYPNTCHTDYITHMYHSVLVSLTFCSWRSKRSRNPLGVVLHVMYWGTYFNCVCCDIPQVKRTSLVDSRTAVNDVKFAPRHLGLQLVRKYMYM